MKFWWRQLEKDAWASKFVVKSMLSLILTMRSVPRNIGGVDVEKYFDEMRKVKFCLSKTFRLGTNRIVYYLSPLTRYS